MKKACVLFLSVFTLPAFASGINSTATSAPCTNNTLETYSGNTNLQADWAPNEIQLRWYNGNTLMDVQSSANTCVYDGALTIPQNAPTRTGYTFAGWQVRPQMDFATIPTTPNGSKRYAKGQWNQDDYCTIENASGSAVQVVCDSDDNLKELQTHEWKTSFSHGDVYGMGVCSTTAGEYEKSGIPTVGEGQYCWCKVTGYKATNSNVISAPSVTPKWIYCHNRENWYTCSTLCATRCAYFTKIYADFRAALFTNGN